MIEWLLPEKRNWLHDVNAGAKFFVVFVLLIIALVNWNPTFALYQAVIYTTLLFFVTGLATYKNRFIIASSNHFCLFYICYDDIVR